MLGCLTICEGNSCNGGPVLPSCSFQAAKTGVVFFSNLDSILGILSAMNFWHWSILWIGFLHFQHLGDDKPVHKLSSLEDNSRKASGLEFLGAAFALTLDFISVFIYAINSAKLASFSNVAPILFGHRGISSGQSINLCPGTGQTTAV